MAIAEGLQAEFSVPEGMRTEILAGGTKVFTTPEAGFGTDALLLARFAMPGRSCRRAAELCSGCGIISLVWHDEGFAGECDAVELLPGASALLGRAVDALGEAGRHIHPLCADLRSFALPGAQAGQYDLVCCNPPYFTGGPRSADPARAGARHADSCTTEDLARCAARLLRDGGKLMLCQRPEHLAEICTALAAVRLEPKRLAAVKNKPGEAPWLFLLEAQKNRNPGLRWLPDILVETGAALYGPQGK